MARIACQQGPPTSRARAGLHGPNRERIRDRICSDATLRCCHTPCGCSYRPGGRPLPAAIRVARTHAVPRACHAPVNPLNTCNTDGRDRCSRDPRRRHDASAFVRRQSSDDISRGSARRRGGGALHRACFCMDRITRTNPFPIPAHTRFAPNKPRCAGLPGRGAARPPAGEAASAGSEAKPTPSRRPDGRGTAATVDDRSAERPQSPPDRRPPCAPCDGDAVATQPRPIVGTSLSSSWQGPQDPKFPKM